MIDFIADIENFKEFDTGVKAHNLFEMKKNGINVPSLFCIDSRILEQYLKPYYVEIKEKIKAAHFADEKSLEYGSLYLKNIVENIEFEDEFKERIFKYIEKNFKEGTLFSVRSSSTVEDSANSSFAGQFDTYLNVSKKDIFFNIKKCLSSMFSANVLKYCHDKSIKISELKMSIIIQEMITADASGIVFTANPRGLLNEMVIVVGKGTGNLVVEDKVPTTTYYYNTNDKNYYFEKQGNSFLLDKNTFSKIIETVNNIKDIYGKYLDIEFALLENVLYILQARPITTLKLDDTIIFDNSNIVESYPGVTLPLTASFVKEAYYGVFHGLSKRVLSNKMLINKYDHVLKEMVSSVNGRMYYNINNWYTVIKFLPLSKKIIPIWQEMLGVTNKQYNSEKIDVSIIQKIKTYFSVIKEFISVPREMEKLNNKYIEVNNYFKANYKNNLDNKVLVELYNDIAEKVLKEWDITLLNDMYAFIFVGLIKYALKKMKIDDYESITNKYISGITNMESMKPVMALVNLAAQSLDEGLIKELKEIVNNERLKEYLEQNPSDFTENFKEYIDTYGDRSLEELKLESNTFRASPITLVEKILEYAEDEDKLLTIRKSIVGGENSKLPGDIFEKCSWLQKKILSLLSEKAMLGIKNREISRLNRSRIYGMVRTIFLTIGENFKNSNLIDLKEDIFYLKTEEVFYVTGGRIVDLKEIISSRKKQYLMFSKIPGNSRLIFTGNVFNKKHTNINSEVMFENGSEILGIPCSNGIVTGEVVVVDDPKKIKAFKDKILITKMTDPGWVFLITLAKGIVAEKGSLLSHTAIISRELNIPSIVGVNNITNILKTGDVIKMNGNTGEIHIKRRRTENVQVN